MNVRDGFVPILDGEPLTRAGDVYVHADGSTVDPARHGEILLVNPHEAPGSSWWQAADRAPQDLPADDLALADAGAWLPSRLDDAELADVLRAVAASHLPLPAVEFDAAFFHRTLARWIGLDLTGAHAGDTNPVWDYDFWKAELFEESAPPGGEDRHFFCVDIHRGEGEGPERYRYWIELDEAGAIKGSGWLTEPPNLLGEEKRLPHRFARFGPDPDLVKRLLSAPD